VVGAQTFERVSVSSSGQEANGDSFVMNSRRVASADGRYVVFESTATNLVADDVNGASDVFLRDRVSGTTVRVNLSMTGGDAWGESHAPSITPDGRYVVFESSAGNLVPDDHNGERDVFVCDLQTGQTQRVSVDSGGGDPNNDSYAPSISDDGRRVAFGSAARDLVPGANSWNTDIFLRDLDLGETFYVSAGHDGAVGDANSWGGTISPDGSHVSFVSGASNLVAAGGYTGVEVFVRDLDLEQTTLVSVAHDGGDSDARSGVPSLSGDGSHVAFYSRAENLVDDDTNGLDDVFVRFMPGAMTERINLSSSGQQTIDLGSWQPSISRLGRYVAFLSDAPNLVPGDANGVGDIFARDRGTGITTRLTESLAGIEADNYSSNPMITEDGRFVVFESSATNLVPGDTNDRRDVFIAWGPAAPFVDGFEPGDTSRWTLTVP
jgi:Tol biopolymer transport system component